jgi:hypothetical protein
MAFAEKNKLKALALQKKPIGLATILWDTQEGVKK